jgi:hypothetical protein
MAAAPAATHRNQRMPRRQLPSWWVRRPRSGPRLILGPGARGPSCTMTAATPTGRVWTGPRSSRVPPRGAGSRRRCLHASVGPVVLTSPALRAAVWRRGPCGPPRGAPAWGTCFRRKRGRGPGSGGWARVCARPKGVRTVLLRAACRTAGLLSRMPANITPATPRRASMAQPPALLRQRRRCRRSHARGGRWRGGAAAEPDPRRPWRRAEGRGELAGAAPTAPPSTPATKRPQARAPGCPAGAAADRRGAPLWEDGSTEITGGGAARGSRQTSPSRSRGGRGCPGSAGRSSRCRRVTSWRATTPARGSPEGNRHDEVSDLRLETVDDDAPDDRSASSERGFHFDVEVEGQTSPAVRGDVGHRRHRRATSSRAPVPTPPVTGRRPRHPGATAGPNGTFGLLRSGERPGATGWASVGDVQGRHRPPSFTLRS